MNLAGSRAYALGKRMTVLDVADWSQISELSNEPMLGDVLGTDISDNAAPVKSYLTGNSDGQNSRSLLIAVTAWAIAGSSWIPMNLPGSVPPWW